MQEISSQDECTKMSTSVPEGETDQSTKMDPNPADCYNGVAFYPEKSKIPISSDRKHVALTLLVGGGEGQTPGSQAVLQDPVLLHFAHIVPQCWPH